MLFFLLSKNVVDVSLKKEPLPVRAKAQILGFG
jgi:hypothetical protein